MARDATTASEPSIPPVPEQPPVPSSPPAAQLSPPPGVAERAQAVGDDDVPFMLETWAGLPKYQCKYCPEAFVEDEMAAWLHYRDWHIVRNQDGTVTRQRRVLTMADVEALKRQAAGG